MSTELLNSQSSESLLTKENLQNASALLALLHGKNDSICRLFNKEIAVDKTQIQRLNEMMMEKLGLHNVQAISTSIDIVFENKRILTFKTFLEYLTYNFDVISSPTKSFFIQWDFLVQLPSYVNPQRHTVSVRITSSLNPSDMFKIMISGALDEAYDFDMQCCTTLCKVDFINNTLAEELVSVVEQWNNLCENSCTQNGKFSQFIYKHAQPIADISAFFCCVTLCAIIAIALKLLTNSGIIHVTLSLFLCVSITFIPIGLAIRSIGKKFAGIIFYKCRQALDTHIFSSSDGDKKKKEKIKNESNYGKEVMVFIMNIIISFAISFFFWFI
jgi:hypothetical protein